MEKRNDPNNVMMEIPIIMTIVRLHVASLFVEMVSVKEMKIVMMEILEAETLVQVSVVPLVLLLSVVMVSEKVVKIVMMEIPVMMIIVQQHVIK